MDNLKIIGTSHIAKQSIKEIKKNFDEFKPDIVAVELDPQRAAALMKEERNRIGLTAIFQIGIKGYLFAKIGQFVQQKLGRMVGVSPGSEMKTALKLAKENKLEIALIDQPIGITLKKFSQSLTWKDKINFFIDILKSLFFPKKQLKEFQLEQFDFSKVPEKEMIKKIMHQMQQRYPSVYKTLVVDRNRYMVNKIVKLLRERKNKKILVIVGAGHEEGIQELLLKIDVIK